MSTNTDDPFDYDHRLESPHANQCRLETRHELIERDAYPDELAIVTTRPGTEVHSQWVVATGHESFVDLAENR